MRFLIDYFRQVFCHHDYVISERYAEHSDYGTVVKSGIRVGMYCKKCGYHKAFWKF